MTEKQNALRSPWVLAWITLLVICVLGIIVMIILAPEPGLVNDDYYRRGQDYEKNMLKRQARVRELGWKARIEEPEFVDVGKPATYGFRISDKDGNPVEADSVTFFAYRLSDKTKDFSLPMKLIGPGFYQADVTFPLLGVWDILVSIKQDDIELNEASRISAGVK